MIQQKYIDRHIYKNNVKRKIEAYIYNNSVLHNIQADLLADSSVLSPETAGGQGRAGRGRLLTRAQDP